MESPAYPELIKALIADLAQYRPSHGTIEPMLALDDQHGQYVLLHVGWDGLRRIRSVILHVRVGEGKIWIEHDGTPTPGFAQALIAAGVPQDAIVLAFQHPSIRSLPEVALA